jgi:U3 small nucleolar RNA-associated protein 19
MPGAMAGSDRVIKRKQTSSQKGPSKRARSESDEEEDVQAQILGLGPKISNSKKYHKTIPILIEIIQNSKKDADSEKSMVAAISLCGAFTRLMVSDQMKRKQGNTSEEAEVVDNLRKQYSKYKAALVELLVEDGIPGSTALDLCMRLLKTEGEHLLKGQESNFPVPFLTRIVRSLLKPGNSGNSRKEFSETYVEEYDDIRFYTLEAIAYELS